MDSRTRQFEEEQKAAAVARHERRLMDEDTSRDMGASKQATTRPPTLGDRLRSTENDLERRLYNVRRLRGALSQDALDLPASILD